MITAVQDPGAVSTRILDAMPFAVIGLSRRDVVTFVNPAAETLLARSAPLLRGRPLTDVIPEDAALLDFIGRARREGGVMSARAIRLASPHIGSVDVDVSASPDGEEGGLVLTLTTVRTGEADNPAEVAAFAQVARMLGHEVKNPLAGIVGAAQLLARKAREDQQPLLFLIREEGARIQRIVDRFAAFETFFSPRARMTNVHAVIDSVVDLARASFGAASKLELQYDPSLPEIEVDPDHLHEACLNLVKNAVEAASVATQRQARIVIATRYRAGFRFAGRDLPRARGALEISVTDNGPGIPENLVGRIFEPFFTTKSGGAGIGLAVVSEIMQAHGGFVVLDNSQGGACLRLLFPFARKKGATP